MSKLHVGDLLRKKAVIFPLSVAGGIHLMNQAVTLRSFRGMLRSDHGNFYETSYANMYYTVKGTGRVPLLLIHDASQFSSSNEWKYVLHSLKKEFRIFLIDLPGCGRSGRPSTEYTNYYYAHLIASFIKDMIKEPTFICATGLSASFSIMAAQEAPEMIKEIVMVNPCPLSYLRRPLKENAHFLRFLLSTPLFGTLIYHFVCSKENIDFLLKEKYFCNPFKVQKATADSFYEASHADGGKGKYFLASLTAGYMNWDIRPALKNPDLSISLIFGSEVKNHAKVRSGYRTQRPDIKEKTIPHTKWLPYLEAPELFSEVLLDLLR